MVVLLVAATGVALLALVIANVMLGQTGIVRASLEQRVAERRTAVEQLRLDVLELSAPARVEARAKKLGLVHAEGAIVIAPRAERSPVRGPSPSRGRP